MNDPRARLEPWHWRGRLEDHRLEVRVDADGEASLWLDGVARKVRRIEQGCAWLWTNVELPFEIHHLVQVRISPVSDDPPVPDESEVAALRVRVTIDDDPVAETTLRPSAG